LGQSKKLHRRQAASGSGLDNRQNEALSDNLILADFSLFGLKSRKASAAQPEFVEC
jgi:hypothetical protein